MFSSARFDDFKYSVSRALVARKICRMNLLSSSSQTSLFGDERSYVRVVGHRTVERKRTGDGEVVPSARQFFEQRQEPAKVALGRQRHEHQYVGPLCDGGHGAQKETNRRARDHLRSKNAYRKRLNRNYRAFDLHANQCPMYTVI